MSGVQAKFDTSQAVRRVIRARRSTRLFARDAEVPFSLVDDIIEYARLSSGYRNERGSMDVRVISDEDCRRRLASDMKGKKQPAVADAPVSIIVGVSKRSLESCREQALIAGGAFVQSMLLRATAHGVDSLWISSFFEEVVAEICELDTDLVEPIAVVPLGYRDRSPRVPLRRRVEERVHWERYDTDRRNHDAEIILEALNVNVAEYDHRGDPGCAAIPELVDRIDREPGLIDALDRVVAGSRFTEKVHTNAATADCVPAMLEAFHWAPSAKNLQSQEIVICREGAELEEQKRLHGLDDQSFSMALVVLGNLNRLGMIEKTTSFKSTTAKRAVGLFAYLDAGATLQNMILALSATGRDYTWTYEKSLKDVILGRVGCPEGIHEFHGVLWIGGPRSPAD